VRRSAAILALLALVSSAAIAHVAGADDSHTYRVELNNAFGLTPGSNVRIAGVDAGTVSDVNVNEAKRAEVEIEVSGPLSRFRADATCSSEPQSLIAEYFIDCQPGTGPEPLD
jgi:ABC-type transporter Mla subunit MlaD